MKLTTPQLERLVDELVQARLRDGPDDVRDGVLNKALELAQSRQMSGLLERVRGTLARPADPLSGV